MSKHNKKQSSPSQDSNNGSFSNIKNDNGSSTTQSDDHSSKS